MEAMEGKGASAERMPPAAMGMPVAQLKTEIEYGGLRTFTFKPNKKNTFTGQVGTAMRAKLDPKDPKTGSDTGGTNAFNNLFAALTYYTNSTWKRGHLLNHDLGGLAVYNNLFPITTAANGEHYQEVEKQVKHWVAKGAKVDYHVVAEQIDEDGRGKFNCYAKPRSGAFQNDVVDKTIYSMPYKIDNTRVYSNSRKEVSRFGTSVAGKDNNVLRDQYKGKYTTSSKWKHHGGSAKMNNRTLATTLDLADLDEHVNTENLDADEATIASSVQHLANLIMEKHRVTADLDLAEEVVTENDFSDWLSVYETEAGL
jgi:hypothetical protein